MLQESGNASVIGSRERLGLILVDTNMPGNMHEIRAENRRTDVQRKNLKRLLNPYSSCFVIPLHHRCDVCVILVKSYKPLLLLHI